MNEAERLVEVARILGSTADELVALVGVQRAFASLEEAVTTESSEARPGDRWRGFLAVALMNKLPPEALDESVENLPTADDLVARNVLLQSTRSQLLELWGSHPEPAPATAGPFQAERTTVFLLLDELRNPPPQDP